MWMCAVAFLFSGVLATHPAPASQIALLSAEMQVGVKGVVHSAGLLRLAQCLPMAVEFFDEPKVVEEALKALHGLLPSGHVVSWPVTTRVVSK